MENSSIDGAVDAVNPESKIPLILAIAAFVLGGLSFVFAWNTKSNLTRHKDTIIKEVNEAVDAAKQAAADARNVGTGSESVAILKTDFEELKTLLTAGQQEIATSQTMIVKNARLLNDRIARLEGGSTRPAVGTTATPASGTTGATTAAAGKYTVQQGDYPAKIAKKLGIRTADLMSANPGLDPKKLQIGQSLNVPEKQ